MTSKEFWQEFWTEVYNEMCFLYGYEATVGEGNIKWYTTPQFIQHGKMCKKQLLHHIWKKRGFEFSDFSYN